MFVEVREPEECQHGHIDASVPAPDGLLEFLSDPTSPRHRPALDPQGRTIADCAPGTPATSTADALRSMGHDDVVALDAGVEAGSTRVCPTCEHEYAGT